MTARRERGQATIELLIFLPLVVVASCAGATILAAQSAGERAGEAARAGAMVLIQGSGPRAARGPRAVETARAAAAELLRPGERDAITIDGRRVTVRLDAPPLLRPLLPRLVTRAYADAGPDPAGSTTAAAAPPVAFSRPAAEAAPRPVAVSRPPVEAAP
jgi:hypothetical protein